MINFNIINDQFSVGSYPQNQVDIQRLRSGPGITAVLNLQTDEDFANLGINWLSLEQTYLQQELACHRWPITDFSADDLVQHLAGVTTALDRLIQVGHRVYIHCTAGVERAPSVAIGYLVWHRGMDLEEAAKLVMTRRSCNPNLDALRTVHATMSRAD